MSEPAAPPVDVSVPGDKSITHRALMLAALGDGESRLSGLLNAADTRATAAALRALGVDIPAGPLGDAVIEGRGLHGLREPDGALDCGNSGTTARFLLGALAGCPMAAEITGDASLRGRPMARVTEPLAGCGARYEALGAPGRLPIRVTGTRALRPIDVVNVRSSAQVKTAMLLAGLTAGVSVRVNESGRPRDHTERLLAAAGAPIRSRATDEGDVIELEAAERLDPLRLTVPGDISSAFFFLALGALLGPVRAADVGLNPTRTGALAVLRRMGVEVAESRTGEEAGEPVGAVVVRPGRLVATVVGAAEVPTLLDEIPMLAVLAVRAEGETRFEGVAELRVKESDRIDALARNLRALGVDVDDGPDHLAIRGTDAPLEGVVDSFGDHRIAMAFGVLGALPRSWIRIRAAEVVGISNPDFWPELKRVSEAMGST